jgi:hypothetical protein
MTRFNIKDLKYEISKLEEEIRNSELYLDDMITGNLTIINIDFLHQDNEEFTSNLIELINRKTRHLDLRVAKLELENLKLKLQILLGGLDENI